MTLPTAVPKPTPRTEADRRASRIASVQKLRCSQTPIQRSSPPSRSQPPRKRNPKRAAKNQARAYGEYADIIRSLPCAACGYAGEKSDAAHVRTGGTSRKADAKWLVPLCKPHNVTATWGTTRLYEGCHRASHRGQRTFEKDSGLNLRELAAALWAKYGSAE